MTWLLIRNPGAGSRRRGRRALSLARERGYDVLETDRRGAAVELARRAATRGATRIAACGGDGTVNEVVRGVDQAGRLPGTTVGVVPTGTGNGFAQDVGVGSVERAFRALDRGRDRWLDVGTAGGRPFLKSCIGGFPAAVSARTSPELKRLAGRLAYSLGVLPYALRTAQERRVAPPAMTVRLGPPDDPAWEGAAALVVVGNSRWFPGVVARPADLEDGLLDVVVVEWTRPRMLGRGVQPVPTGRTPYLVRRRVAELAVDGSVPVPFSLDGEVVERSRLSVGVRERAMRTRVGPDYAGGRRGGRGDGLTRGRP